MPSPKTALSRPLNPFSHTQRSEQRALLFQVLSLILPRMRARPWENLREIRQRFERIVLGVEGRAAEAREDEEANEMSCEIRSALRTELEGGAKEEILALCMSFLSVVLPLVDWCGDRDASGAPRDDSGRMQFCVVEALLCVLAWFGRFLASLFCTRLWLLMMAKSLQKI